MVVVVEDGPSVAGVDPSTAQRLSRLGVTNVAIGRDGTTQAIVLEGWAFDPQRCGQEAAGLVSASASHKCLQPALQVQISPDPGAKKGEA